MQPTPLFNPRVLRKYLNTARFEGVELPEGSALIARQWHERLTSGAIDKLSESQVEQTFNNQIFGKLLGYRQIGETAEASLMPKTTGATGRDIPDFVIGRFDPTANVEQWIAVGEVKDSRSNLDQPQLNRENNETPVEQGFRYATRGRPGIEWVIISNFKEIRLYKNGYTGAFHRWYLHELRNPDKLFEFYALMRPASLIDFGRSPLTARLFRDGISAGKEMTENFYGLYKLAQQKLLTALRPQAASEGLSTAALYGKTHKLLNRLLFAAFCEDHPAELLPRDTLRTIRRKAELDQTGALFWHEYQNFFNLLNSGGGSNGRAINAFNGGLFAPDPYLSQIEIPDQLFTERIQFSRGKRKSLEISGVFGFEIYDFAEDLNAQALGAIFEQSLKDIVKGTKLVRGFGEIDVTNQKTGGVFYTPREITAYIVKGALDVATKDIARSVRDTIDVADVRTKKRGARARQAASEIVFYDRYVEAIKRLQILDPACGSGAFLVEALEQLRTFHEKVHGARAALLGHSPHQQTSFDLNRQILRTNLHGRDILEESVEIARLSLWLRTAAKGEKLEVLDGTICVADSLRDPTLENYDIIIGNPPWGSDLEGWTDEEIQRRFPDCGEEKDSYAVFMIRSWEALKPGGILAFIVPNSWITVEGYETFRGWLLRHFEVLEICNVWKIFADVNHDACILFAKKRPHPLPNDDIVFAASEMISIKAVARGVSELEKRKRLAEEQWLIDHWSTAEFQWRQVSHRFETIFEPEVANQLDRIAGRCRPLGSLADVTVGIQVYHNTRVSKEFIKARGFHSNVRNGSDWHPFVESNDVQRYFCRPSSDQWLKYSSLLHDKRDLQHYQQPRILVQQIFWQRLSAWYEAPTQPRLYLNTLFAVYNARDVPLLCLLGIINSRFISATYERRSNRLLGDKFPKVSKLDLASVPVPRMPARLAEEIAGATEALQARWTQFRGDLVRSGENLAAIDSKATLADFDLFWELRESEFVKSASEKYGASRGTDLELIRQSHRTSVAAVNAQWHEILSAENELDELVARAFRVSDGLYSTLVRATPTPDIRWALLAMH